MIIISEYLGKTGNQLFQYSFARILAQALAVAFAVPKLSFFPNCPNKGAGTVINSPTIALDDTDQAVTKSSLQEIAAQCRNKRVELLGFYQRADYYSPFRELIRGWFPKTPRRIPQIALHARGIDYPKGTPPISYYKDALALLPRDLPVVLYTDDPALPVVESLSVTVSKSDSRDSFFEISDSLFIVTSYSTYAWWAAFLSDATVLQPAPPSGFRLAMPAWTQIEVP